MARMLFKTFLIAAIAAIGFASGAITAQESSNKSQTFRTIVDGQQHTTVLKEGVCLKQVKNIPFATVILKDAQEYKCGKCSGGLAVFPNAKTNIVDLNGDQIASGLSFSTEWPRGPAPSADDCASDQCCTKKVSTKDSTKPKCIQDIAMVGYDCPTELLRNKNIPFIGTYIAKAKQCKCERCCEIQAAVKNTQAKLRPSNVVDSNNISLKNGYAIIIVGGTDRTAKINQQSTENQQDQSKSNGRCEISVEIKAVPFLSRLPLIGTSFKSKSAKKETASDCTSGDSDNCRPRLPSGVHVKVEEVPVLSNVPFVNRLFKNVCVKRDDEQESSSNESTAVTLPTLSFTEVNKTVSVPDGGTIIIGGITLPANRAAVINTLPSCYDDQSCCNKEQCKQNTSKPKCNKCNVIMYQYATPSATKPKVFSVAGFQCPCCENKCDKGNEKCCDDEAKCCPHGTCQQSTTVALPRLPKGHGNQTVCVPDGGICIIAGKRIRTDAAKTSCPDQSCCDEVTCCPANSECCEASCCPSASRCCEGDDQCCPMTTRDFTATVPPANARVLHNPYALPQPRGEWRVAPAPAPANEMRFNAPPMLEEMMELRIENERLKARIEAMEQHMEMMAEMAKLRAENQVLMHMINNKIQRQPKATTVQPWQPVHPVAPGHPLPQPYVNAPPILPPANAWQPATPQYHTAHSNQPPPARCVAPTAIYPNPQAYPPARKATKPKTPCTAPGCNDAKCVSPTCPVADPAQPTSVPKTCKDPACEGAKCKTESRPTGEYVPSTPAGVSNRLKPIINDTGTAKPANTLKTIKVFDAGKPVTGKITVPQVFSIPMAMPATPNKAVAAPAIVQKSNLKQAISIVRLEKQVEQLQAEIKKLKTQRTAEKADMDDVSPKKADADDIAPFKFYGGIR